MTVSLSFDASVYTPGTRHRAHQHDSLHLSLVLSGRVAETVGRNTEYASALSVVAKDAGVTHADDFGSEGAKLARLTLPSGTIAALVDDPSRSSGWRWTHDDRVANPFLQLVRRANAGVFSFDIGDPDLIDLLAALTARAAPLPRGGPPAWLDETMRELRESWKPGLTVTELARRAGVHPVYLARSVRRWFGTGVAEELRRLRIRSAAAALTETTQTVSRVAHAGGFADEPHLCREFHRAMGMTPRRYRVLVAGLGRNCGGRS